MATSVARAAQPNFRVGLKSVYLPKHVITFIRPKNPRQPPNLATFIVPLRFNKLDLRDYLWHAYGVEVTSVRSFINQRPPERRNNGTGAWYRPQSQKMMIVELVKPFVWPKALGEEDAETLEKFDYDIHHKMQQAREKNIEWQQERQKGGIPERNPWQMEHEEVKGLVEQAKELVMGKVDWSDERNITSGRAAGLMARNASQELGLEGNWTEVDKELDGKMKEKRQVLF